MNYVFYFNGQQLDVYLANSAGIERLIECPANEAGYHQFSEFLKQQTVLPCQLLVDLIEEEFREESLPHVSGADQTNLHKRQAAKLFRTTPFRHSQVISRDKSGRRDDHVLFSSLTNKDIIEPWLEIIKQQRLPLTGIHSLSVITPRLVKSFDAKSANILIVTQQRGDNLRQTFIKDNQVRFSRLAPQLGSDKSSFGTIANAEIEKTKRYLNTLKLLDFDASLEVIVISDTEHLSSAKAICNNTDQMHYTFHSTRDVAQLLGMKSYPDNQYSDSIFVSLLCKKRNPNHYAQTEHLYHYRTFQASRALKIFSGSLTAAALLWCGLNIADAIVLKHETKILQASAEQAQDRLRHITGAALNKSINPEDILAAVKISEALEKRSIRPDRSMHALGTALLQYPHLILDKLVWNSNQPVTPRTEKSNTALTEQNSPANNQIQNVLVAEGHIEDFNGSYLQANNDIKLFVRKLTEQPGVIRVDITRYPINTSSTAAMVGKLLNNARPGKAYFTVRVIMDRRRAKS